MRSTIAAGWIVKAGYTRVKQFPWGYQGWTEFTSGKVVDEARSMRPGRGDPFPHFRLTILKGDVDRSYLDLESGRRAFSLEDLKAEFLILEVFSELCTLCQKALPSYKQLFEQVNANRVLASRVKMIGMGIESRKRAMARFRKDHQVAYPLFADERGEIFGALGEPELPVIYLLKREKNKGRILLVHHGALENVQQFTKGIAAAIGEECP